MAGRRSRRRLASYSMMNSSLLEGKKGLMNYASLTKRWKDEKISLFGLHSEHEQIHQIRKCKVARCQMAYHYNQLIMGNGTLSRDTTYKYVTYFLIVKRKIHEPALFWRRRYESLFIGGWVIMRVAYKRASHMEGLYTRPKFTSWWMMVATKKLVTIRRYMLCFSFYRGNWGWFCYFRVETPKRRRCRVRHWPPGGARQGCPAR